VKKALTKTVTADTVCLFYSWYCRVGTDLWYFSAEDCPTALLQLEANTDYDIKSGFGWFFGTESAVPVGPFLTREDAVGGAKLFYPTAM